jgi:hypothetical protein
VTVSVTLLEVLDFRWFQYLRLFTLNKISAMLHVIFQFVKDFNMHVLSRDVSVDWLNDYDLWIKTIFALDSFNEAF